jgi:L-alanine-DL-glutamate epimerase-like enolase superfamily enzyme
MRITALETLRLVEHPEYLWVKVETDEGLVGLGETMPRVGSVERIVHDVLAPILIGSDPAPEALWQRVFQAIAYHGYAGAELRALSAVDIALWDLLGQRAGLPIHRLLGGPCREQVPVYNTCVGFGGNRDHDRFTAEPVELAQELAAAGYPAMKIWPFDDYSTASHGQRISSADLASGARPFAEIHEALGPDIKVALEGHGCWSLPAAIEIAGALEPYQLLWLEDMLPTTDPSAWRALREATSIPICGSERAFTRHGIAPFLKAGALDIVKQDITWTGGFTEFMKIASLADQHALPVAPHNCLGPVGAMATLHASAALPNLYLMESVRSFTEGFHHVLADGAPVIDSAVIAVPERPGLGVTLRPEAFAQASRARTDSTEPAATMWTSGDPWRASASAG